MMSGIQGKNTKPEQIVRRALFAAGFRFRLHRRDLPGIPDVVLPGRRVVIFVHGCFWHRHQECGNANLPSTHSDFWREKLDGNALRDQKNVAALLELGWRVLIVWECATRKNAPRLPEALAAWIQGNQVLGELVGTPKVPVDQTEIF